MSQEYKCARVLEVLHVFLIKSGVSIFLIISTYQKL